MKRSYTFTVIRYVHDRAAGEALNIGVLVYAPEAGFLDVKVEPRFERLSRTFASFDGDTYRSTLARLNDAVHELARRVTGVATFRDMPKDAAAVIRSVWPDTGLSFECGPAMAGVSSARFENVLAELFGRMVSSQAPSRSDAERRSDEEVWAGAYNVALRRAGVSHILAPRTLASADFTMTFDHAFENQRTHVVQPVTMDFVKSDSLQEKATRWVGTGTALKGHPRLGKLYILLGEPRHESHRSAYDKAKNLLHRIPVKHEIVEERDAESFADELAAYMKEHGIIEG